MIAIALTALVLAAPPANAARPSILHLSTDKWMAGVFVDGTPLTRDDCTSPKSCTITDIAPGPHEIDIRGGLGGKVIYKGFVTVAGGAELFAKAIDGKLDIYNSQPRVFADDGVDAVAGDATTTTTVQQTTTVSGAQPDGGVSIGMTVTDPTTGQTVHLGAAAGPNGAMGGVSQSATTTTTTTTTVSGSTDVDLAAHPPRKQGAGALELTSEDGQSFTVYIDGKKMGTFNGLEGQSMKLRNVRSGEHKLVIKDFMEHRVFTSGRLYMDPDFTLKLGVTESSVEAFNNQNAWQQY